MLNSLKWKIIAMVLAAAGSTAAGGFAADSLFQEGWLESLLSDPQKIGATGGAAVLLPIIFLLMSGVKSYLFSVAILTAAMLAGLVYLGVDVPFDQLGPACFASPLPESCRPIMQLLTVTGVGSAVAVLVYRIIT
ncbi:MAG: hypothetical protein AAFQ73_09290 [Pseudomonadota bacterium]